MDLRTTGLRHKGHDVAEDAWAHLVDTAGVAGENTRHSARAARRQAERRTGRWHRRARHQANEAHRRANAAVDALVGRRPPVPWGWIVGAALAGAALGWAAATLAGRPREFPAHPVDLEEPSAEPAPGRRA